MTTHAEARRVLVAELERARVDVSSIPSSVISTVARRVAVGDCTIAQAVEFFQVSLQCQSAGLSVGATRIVVGQLGARQRGAGIGN